MRIPNSPYFGLNGLVDFHRSPANAAIEGMRRIRGDYRGAGLNFSKRARRFTRP